MYKIKPFLLLFILFANAAYAQTPFFISENYNDYLYREIYNEVTFYSKIGVKTTGFNIESNEAMIVKKDTSTFLIKPMGDNIFIKVRIIYNDKELGEKTINYLVKDLPSPKIRISPHVNYHAKMPNNLIDSLEARIELENNRVINLNVQSFEVVLIKKGVQIKNIIVTGKYLTAFQKKEMKAYLVKLGTGDLIELRNIRMTNGEIERIVRLKRIPLN